MDWLTHCSIFRGPASQTHNMCVNRRVFSFTSMVRLYHGSVWLRKGLVFLTYRDLCFFFFLTFPLEDCCSMCNSMPLLHLAEKVTPPIDTLMMCLCPVNFSIHEDLQFGSELAAKLAFSFCFMPIFFNLDDIMMDLIWLVCAWWSCEWCIFKSWWVAVRQRWAEATEAIFNDAKDASVNHSWQMHSHASPSSLFLRGMSEMKWFFKTSETYCMCWRLSHRS